MSALCSPVAINAISRASRMVAIPIVIASRGTLSSPKKSADASFRVTVSSVTRRVRSSGDEPGSSPDERTRSEEHTSELQSRQYIVCRLLLEKKKKEKQASSPWDWC